MAATYNDLIRQAQLKLRPKRLDDRVVGDVAAVLVTDGGRSFAGVSFDASSAGLCAERSAVASMLTAGEFVVKRIVAVWQEWEGRDGALYVLPPCGHCRQLLIDVDARNASTQVILGPEEAISLGELLPRSEWPRRPVLPGTE